MVGSWEFDVDVEINVDIDVDGYYRYCTIQGT